jgi:hypothetical protein
MSDDECCATPSCLRAPLRHKTRCRLCTIRERSRVIDARRDRLDELVQAREVNERVVFEQIEEGSY